MFDFHIDLVMSDEELTAVLSRVFDTPTRDIHLVGIGEFPEDDVPLFCIRWVNGGDFPLHLSVHPSGIFEAEVVMAQRFCAESGARCIITDDSPYPWSWIFVDATGCQGVLVDGGHLDENEFVISAATGAFSSSS